MKTALNKGKRNSKLSKCILKNEKYAGILKQKKRITIDYLSHKTKMNESEEAYITIANNHEPIVTKEIFDEVQTAIMQRKKAAMEKSRYSNRYVWSGKIECAQCKSKFERRVNNKKTEQFQVVWRCSEAIKYGKEKNNAQGQRWVVTTKLCMNGFYRKIS